MKRGDIVIMAMQGDLGKPRPALVIQSDIFNEDHPTLTIAPLSTTITDTPLFRLMVEPDPANGLRAVTQVMIDKMSAIRREKIGQVIGRLDELTMQRVNRAAALWLGLAV